MFDIGFAELLLIAVVGLLVIGPERLPSTIRTVSLWLGRFRRSFNEIRSEIEREVGADEIRRQLHNEAIMSALEDGRKSLEKQSQAALDEADRLGAKIRTLSDSPANADESLSQPLVDAKTDTSTLDESDSETDSKSPSMNLDSTSSAPPEDQAKP